MAFGQLGIAFSLEIGAPDSRGPVLVQLVQAAMDARAVLASHGKRLRSRRGIGNVDGSIDARRRLSPDPETIDGVIAGDRNQP